MRAGAASPSSTNTAGDHAGVGPAQVSGCHAKMPPLKGARLFEVLLKQDLSYKLDIKII